MHSPKSQPNNLHLHLHSLGARLLRILEPMQSIHYLLLSNLLLNFLSIHHHLLYMALTIYGSSILSGVWPMS